MSHKSRIYALCLALIGCSNPLQREPKMTFHGDIGFNADERSCVLSAAKQWEDQTHGLASIGVVWDYNSRDPYSVVNHTLNHKLIQSFSHDSWTQARDARIQEDCRKANPGDDCKWAITLGNARNEIQDWPVPVEVRLVSDRIRDAKTCKQVAMHEFGHAFGMDHTGSQKDVMFPQTVAMDGCLTTNDLAEFCNHNACGMFIPKGCE